MIQIYNARILSEQKPLLPSERRRRASNFVKDDTNITKKICSWKKENRILDYSTLFFYKRCFDLKQTYNKSSFQIQNRGRIVLFPIKQNKTAKITKKKNRPSVRKIGTLVAIRDMFLDPVWKRNSEKINKCHCVEIGKSKKYFLNSIFLSFLKWFSFFKMKNKRITKKSSSVLSSIFVLPL